jgi:hypothetical protein
MDGFDACELVGLLAQEARVQRLLHFVSVTPGSSPADFCFLPNHSSETRSRPIVWIMGTV